VAYKRKYPHKYWCNSGWIIRHNPPKNPYDHLVSAKDLPKLYGVIHWECAFADEDYTPELIKLTPRQDEDYKEHLEILKLEKLLNGGI
jgi:hypothetical protein